MNYIRKVNKSSIPTCNIMGVNIATINMEWLKQYLKDNPALLEEIDTKVREVYGIVPKNKKKKEA